MNIDQATRDMHDVSAFGVKKRFCKAGTWIPYTDENPTKIGVSCSKCNKGGAFSNLGTSVCDKISDAPFPKLCPCTLATQYRDDSGLCKPCPEGYMCKDNAVYQLCLEGDYCPPGTTVAVGGLTCTPTDKRKDICNKKGSYNKYGQSVCAQNKKPETPSAKFTDKLSTTPFPELCDNGSGLTTSYGFGVRVFYLEIVAI